MRKALMLIGVLFLVILIIFIFVIVYANIDKKQYDDIAEEHIRKVINELSDLTMEQFETYWGPNKPGTPEFRTNLVKSISKLGTLTSIDTIQIVKYGSKFSININYEHYYVYKVNATYSNGTATITMILKGTKSKLFTQDIKFSSNKLNE